jgi:WG containing repeat
MVVALVILASLPSLLFCSDVRRGFSRAAGSKGPLPVMRDGEWGYIDHSGKVVIKPQFEWAEFFYEDRAAVQLNGKWGYVDTTGNMVIPTEYQTARNFSDGVASVIAGTTPPDLVFEYIDAAGGVVYKCQRGCGYPYYEGMMAEAVEVFRCVDDLGRPVPKQYPCAPDATSNSHAIFVDRWGYYDKSGKLAIEGLFHSGLGRFSEGLAYAEPYGGRKWGYIDKSGSFVISPQFDGQPKEFSEGFAAVQVNAKWGFVDHSGKFVIDPQFESVWSFSNGLALFYLRGKYGYVDRTGSKLFYAQFENSLPFSEGFAPACCKDGKWGYIDKSGEFRILLKLKGSPMDIGPFSDGVALVPLEDGLAYINREGSIIAYVYEKASQY